MVFFRTKTSLGNNSDIWQWRAVNMLMTPSSTPPGIETLNRCLQPEMHWMSPNKWKSNQGRMAVAERDLAPSVTGRCLSFFDRVTLSQKISLILHRLLLELLLHYPTSITHSLGIFVIKFLLYQDCLIQVLASAAQMAVHTLALAILVGISQIKPRKANQIQEGNRPGSANAATGTVQLPPPTIWLIPSLLVSFHWILASRTPLMLAYLLWDSLEGYWFTATNHLWWWPICTKYHGTISDSHKAYYAARMLVAAAQCAHKTVSVIHALC